MSWESTVLYYRLINEETRRILGGLHSAPIAMISVDFHEIEEMQRRGDWEEAGKTLAGQASKVELAGADFLVICTNTMHKIAAEIESAISIPILHIAHATAKAVVKDGVKTVGLIGTNFTMEQDFYKERLINRGLVVLVPNAEDREAIHRVIYEELCLGIINAQSREIFLQIIERLRDSGAEGIIEGCTEVAMLVGQRDTDMPLFDTTAIHAREAVEEALRGMGRGLV